ELRLARRELPEDGEPRLSPGQVPGELSRDAAHERRRRLKPELRAIERRALPLLDRREAQRAVAHGELRREARQDRLRGGEPRVLLVSNLYRSRPGEQGVGPHEGHAADVVVHLVVGVAHERPAVDGDAFRAGADLDRAEADDPGGVDAARLIADAQPIERRRMLRRIEILAGDRVDGVVALIPARDEAGIARTERPERRDDRRVVVHY